ncbi:MAG: Stealth CR1 domain-containing protein [Treponema sp.]|nr:Stealth CR1 domain-containing protein [Treponema sp.]
MNKIDIVYSWCDGNDPNFIKEKQNTLKKHNITLDPVQEKRRYQQNDELKYSLRSVEKYAPWVNHIYIITNKQRPAWLKDNNKVTIIDHSQIIPPKYRPTFNSVCIEYYIINIPGLEDNFLYLNDDVFFNRPVKPEDFFINKKPIVRLNTKVFKTLFYQTVSVTNKTILNSYYKMTAKNKIYFPFIVPVHGVDSYSIKLIKEINKKYPEIKELNSTPFRTETHMQRVIYAYEMAYINNCKLIIYDYSSSKISKLFDIILFRTRKKYFCMEHQDSVDNIKWSILKIRLYRPLCFCFNDITDDTVMKKFLNQKFKKKSSFEL